VGVYPGTSQIFWVPQLSQEWVKLRTLNFVRTFTGLLGAKALKKFSKSSRGRTQGLSKIFRANIYKVHRAVIVAVARLSCLCKVIVLSVSVPVKWFWTSVNIWWIYTVSEKKRPQFFRHNFNQCRRSFIVFIMNHPEVFVCKWHFWWRQIWRHPHAPLLWCWVKFSNGSVRWSIRMIRVKN